jgi:hypothetical protein
MNAAAIIWSPREYFREFRRRAPRWPVALLAFASISFVERVGELAFEADIPWDRVLSQAGLAIAIGVPFNLLLFGVLWFFVGSRLFGGSGSLGDTILAVGYAFLWPGLLAVAHVLAQFTALHGSALSREGFLTSVAIRLGLGLWALALATVAARQLHRLSWPRTLGVVLWLPLLLAIVVGTSVVLP